MRAWLFALALAGCGQEGGDLSGSLDEIYRLEHTGVRARLYSSELAIEYTRDDGSVPVRVSLRGTPETIGEGEYDLFEMGGLGGRAPDGNEVPAMISGTLEIDTYEPTEGGDCSGSFEATFEAGRDRLNLNGSFNAPLDVVGWPPRPEDFEE